MDHGGCFAHICNPRSIPPKTPCAGNHKKSGQPNADISNPTFDRPSGFCAPNGFERTPCLLYESVDSIIYRLAPHQFLSQQDEELPFFKPSHRAGGKQGDT